MVSAVVVGGACVLILLLITLFSVSNRPYRSENLKLRRRKLSAAGAYPHPKRSPLLKRYRTAPRSEAIR